MNVAHHEYRQMATGHTESSFTEHDQAVRRLEEEIATWCSEPCVQTCVSWLKEMNSLNPPLWKRRNLWYGNFSVTKEMQTAKEMKDTQHATCWRRVAARGGNTSNMIRHLREHHQSLCAKFKVKFFLVFFLKACWLFCFKSILTKFNG